jgi:thymidylate synthase ThyX
MAQKSKISAEVIAHSLNIETGDHLITFRILCPKFILAEINTHRILSKSFSSSRAIPSKKMRSRVIQDPVIPVEFGKNKKGMQSSGSLAGWRLVLARQCWLLARYPACFFHWLGEKAGLHKQVCNRIIEPWVWAEGVVSGTSFENLYKLRCHFEAQPEFLMLATDMRNAASKSTPRHYKAGLVHLPFVSDEELETAPITELKMVSAARCGRVSYYLKDGKRSTLAEDIAFCDRLAGSNPKHLSPFEHVATAMTESGQSGNFIGWMQYRKEIEKT